MAFELHPVLEKDVSPRPGIWYAVEGGAAPPVARVGASALRTREVGCALLCAGASPEEPFSDLHRLKIHSDSISWETLPSMSLPPRYEHTLALGPSGSDIFVFAGAQENGPLADLWTCTTDGGEWREVGDGVPGDHPPPRTHHTSACVWGEKMVVFSGGDSGTHSQDNSVYIFDMVTPCWQRPAVEGTPPSPRQGHTLAVVGATLYVHGGMTGGGEVVPDLFTLNLERMRWSEPQLNGGTPSPALAAHGCAVAGRSLYVFGGLGSAVPPATPSTAWKQSLSWKVVKTEGAAPPSRLDFAMTTITLNLRRNPSLSHSHKRSSPISRESQLTASPSPHIVTVLSPEMEGESGKTQTVDKSTASVVGTFARENVAGDGVEEKNDRENLPTLDEEKREIETCACDERYWCREDATEGDEGEGEGGLVTALIIFGGMDTEGHVHNDCFVLVPPAP